jgi:aldehyde:ferredoxin oxidoreductase
MAYGYMGKILLVDLGSGEIKEEVIPDEIYERYLSGTGLATYLLYKMIPAGADPLGPDNVLALMSGLLTGTGSLFTGRWMAAGKSPLTGTWGDANCGGYFSPAIKRCGYDGILFRGISKTPVYLYVDGKTAVLRDASHVWGKDIVETEEALLAETASTARMAMIGPAGEKLSLISGICTDRGRLAARSGLGAVMGSKKLKAVVLNGKKRIPVKDMETIKAFTKKCHKNIPPPVPIPGKMTRLAGVMLRKLPFGMLTDGKAVMGIYRKWGTSAMNQMSIESGDSPIKNWGGSNEDFPEARSRTVNPDNFIAREKVKYHCYSCPLGCGGICTLPGGKGETHKPEYETILALGGLCMNENADAIFTLNEMLNRAGMDTISAGATVAFAMECYEKGIISKEDAGGMDLSWGNPRAVIYLIEKMIAREGIGDILADGTKVAARKLGKGAENCAVHAGGQVPAMQDSRFDPGFALHYSAEPTPGRHTLGSWLYYELWQLWETVKDVPRAPRVYLKSSKYKADDEKARIGAANSRFMNVVNGVGMCMFGTLLGTKRIFTFEWLNAATGWNKSPNEYMDIGDHIQTVKQAFNVKQGIEPASMRISSRALGAPPMTHGANKGRSVDIENLVRDYWTQFGWDPKTGKPTEASMKKAGL